MKRSNLKLPLMVSDTVLLPGITLSLSFIGFLMSFGGIALIVGLASYLFMAHELPVYHSVSSTPFLRPKTSVVLWRRQLLPYHRYYDQ